MGARFHIPRCELEITGLLNEDTGLIPCRFYNKLDAIVAFDLFVSPDVLKKCDSLNAEADRMLVMLNKV